MPQRRNRVNQEREVKKELRQKKRRLAQLMGRRSESLGGNKTEEILRLEQRIAHLENWLEG